MVHLSFNLIAQMPLQHQTVQTTHTRRLINPITRLYRLHEALASRHQRIYLMSTRHRLTQRYLSQATSTQHNASHTSTQNNVAHTSTQINVAHTTSTQNNVAHTIAAQQPSTQTTYLPQNQVAPGNLTRDSGGVPSNTTNATALGGVPSNWTTTTALNTPDVWQTSIERFQSVFYNIYDIINEVHAFMTDIHLLIDANTSRRPQSELNNFRINRIQELPSSKYTDDVKDAACGDRCNICLGDYEKGDDLRHLPCCHMFHSQCVDQWLKTKSTCPLCRRNVMKNMSRQLMSAS